MFFRIMKFWFTGKDNESYEIMRALTALSVIVMLGYDLNTENIENVEMQPKP